MTVAVIVATAPARDRPARPGRAARLDGGGKRYQPISSAGQTTAIRAAEAGPVASAAAERTAAPASNPVQSAESAAAARAVAEPDAPPGNTLATADPAAALPCPALRAGRVVTEPLLGRLCGQLVTLGIRDVVLIAPPGYGDHLRDIAADGMRRGAPRITIEASSGVSIAGERGRAPETTAEAPGGVSIAAQPRRPAGNTATIGVIECAGVAAQLRAIARLSRDQRHGDDALLICAGDLVAHTGALAMAADAAGTAALVEAPDGPSAAVVPAGGDLRPAVRTTGRRAGRAVASAGSSFHRVAAADAVGCGVFLVSAGDLGELGDAAERCAALAGAADSPRAFADPLALLLVGLVRGGVTVAAIGVNPLRCVRVCTSQQARAAAGQLPAAPEDRVRMHAAVKAADGFAATFLVSPYSRYAARWAARRGVTPHAVTGASAGLALLAAVWYSAGTRSGLIAGSVFVFAAFALDCVDGQLARYTRSTSAFGSWLDPVSDRVKEYAIYAGLAIGGTAAHQRGVWVLASTAMIVQAIRYTIGLSWRIARPAATRPEPVRAAPLPLDEPADYAVPPAAAPDSGGSRGRLRKAGRRLRRAAAVPARALRWPVRIGYLGVGERFLVIAVTAAVAGPRATFGVLIAWGAAVAVVTVAVLVTRSLAAGRDGRRAQRPAPDPRPPLTSLAMASYRDDGIIVQWLGRLAGGYLPPVLPAVAGVTVTAALAAAGLHYGRILAIAPVAAMLLAGLGRDHPHDRRLDWLVPPLLRAGEYIYLAAVGVAAAVPGPVIFALLGAIAVHHYDVACRERLSHVLAPLPRAVKLGLGWEGRMLVAAVGATLGIAPFAYTVLSAYVWILFGWESLTTWLSAPDEDRLAVAPAVDLEDGGGW